MVSRRKVSLIVVGALLATAIIAYILMVGVRRDNAKHLMLTQLGDYEESSLALISLLRANGDVEMQARLIALPDDVSIFEAIDPTFEFEGSSPHDVRRRATGPPGVAAGQGATREQIDLGDAPERIRVVFELQDIRTGKMLVFSIDDTGTRYVEDAFEDKSNQVIDVVFVSVDRGGVP